MSAPPNTTSSFAVKGLAVLSPFIEVYMPGFKTSGSLSSMDSSVNDVIFVLRSSAGADIKTYKVPEGEADSFSASIQAEEPNIRSQVGETSPLRLVKISKVF